MVVLTAIIHSLPTGVNTHRPALGLRRLIVDLLYSYRL